MPIPKASEFETYYLNKEKEKKKAPPMQCEKGGACEDPKKKFEEDAIKSFLGDDPSPPKREPKWLCPDCGKDHPAKDEKRAEEIQGQINRLEREADRWPMHPKEREYFDRIDDLVIERQGLLSPPKASRKPRKKKAKPEKPFNRRLQGDEEIE